MWTHSHDQLMAKCWHLTRGHREQGAGFCEIVVQTSAYMEPGYKVRMLEVTCVLSALLTQSDKEQLIGLQKNGRKCLGEHS